MQVAIKSPSFEANKRFAEDLIPKTLELFYPRYNDKYFKRAEFQKDTEVIKDNALYLASDKELNEITDWLQEEIETAREEANPFFIDFEEKFPSYTFIWYELGFFINPKKNSYTVIQNSSVLFYSEL